MVGEKNYKIEYQMKAPFTLYANFEAIPPPSEEDNEKATTTIRRLRKHKAAFLVLHTVCSDKDFQKHQFHIK